MKTITFSNDQLAVVRAALQEKIGFLEFALSLNEKSAGVRDVMRIRDELDVARQALEAVQS